MVTTQTRWPASVTNRGGNPVVPSTRCRRCCRPHAHTRDGLCDPSNRCGIATPRASLVACRAKAIAVCRKFGDTLSVYGRRGRLISGVAKHSLTYIQHKTKSAFLMGPARQQSVHLWASARATGGLTSRACGDAGGAHPNAMMMRTIPTSPHLLGVAQTTQDAFLVKWF